MSREGRYGSSITIDKPTNRIGRYSSAPEEEQKIAPYIQPTIKPTNQFYTAPKYSGLIDPKFKVISPTNNQTIRVAQPVSTPSVKVAPTVSTPKVSVQKPSAPKNFNATYYDPRDPWQTRPEADGIGAFNTPVVFGDVATGQRHIPQGTLIKVPELADVQTPYGMGVFRVNDKKNKRYDTATPNFDIALPADTPNREALQKRIGNNVMSFEPAPQTVKVAEPQQTPNLRVIGAEPEQEKKSGIAGFIDSFASWDSGDLPYYGSGKEALENIRVVNAYKRFEKGTATPEDKKTLDDYYRMQEIEAKKRENVGYNAGEIIKGSARFMAELLPAVLTEVFTGGLAPTGDMMVLNQAAKVGVRKTLERMAKDKVYKATFTGALKNTIKKEGDILIKQFALTAPTNITLGTAQRMIGNIDTETGQVIEEGQSIGEALVNATTNHAVELLTERGGGVTGKILGKLSAPAKKVVVKTAVWQALRKRFPKATESQLVKVLNKAGWNGVMGEWFEERDADLLNNALFEVGLGDQDFEGLTKDQVVAEIIAFSVMGGGHAAVTNVGGRLFKGGEDTGGPGDSIVVQDDGAPPPGDLQVPPPGDTQTIINQDISGPDGQDLVITHFTGEENVDSILTNGFDSSKAPIHGIKGKEAGEATGKFGEDVLYFTTDTGRWNTAQVFVGEGKGDISQNVFNYDTQKWEVEENAYKKIDLAPIESTIKDDAKILTIDSLDNAKAALGAHTGESKFDKHTVIEDLIATARKAGYDIVNIKEGRENAWVDQNEDPTKTGYNVLTGNSGNSDYFVLNKEVLNIKGAQQEAPVAKPAPFVDKPRGTQGPGHQHFEKWVQNLLKDGTINEEDAVIMRVLVENFDDTLLLDTKFGRIRSDSLTKAGSFTTGINPFALITEGRAYDETLEENPPDSAIEPKSGLLKLRTGLSKTNVPSWVFAHEFSHLGYYFVLNEQERQIVIDEYNRLSQAEKESLFSHVDKPSRVRYYTGTPSEFFAQSGADYMIENKVPSEKMEPLLKKVAKEFFNSIKKLVSRGEVGSVNKLRPLFEKILIGDRSTPLSEYAKMEPLTWKAELKRLMDIAPTASKITEGKKPLFTGGKEDRYAKFTVGTNAMTIDEMLDELANRRMNEGQTDIPLEGMSQQDAMAYEAETRIMEKTLKLLGIDIEKELFKEPVSFEESLFASEPGETPMEAAEQARQKAMEGLEPDIAETLEPLEEVIGSDVRTPIRKRVNWIDKLRTPYKVMRKLGVQKEWRGVVQAYDNYMHELPQNIDKIKNWMSQVSKESNERIFRYLDGEDGIQLNEVEMRVATEIKVWLSEWADRLGMSSDERITDYITHIFPRGSSGEIPEEIAALIRDKSAKSIYNPFQLHRTGAEGYKTDTWAALEAYVKRATRKANIDPALEVFNQETAHLSEASQMEYIEKRLSTLNMRPTSVETAVDNMVKSAFPNIGPRPSLRLTTQFRKMLSRSKIAGSLTSFAKNITQGVNTLAELGTRYTTRGYIDLVKFGGKELKDNGVLGSYYYDQDPAYSALKQWAERFDRVLFMNMESTELLNRGAAYYGAKAKFLDGKISNKEFNLAFGYDYPDVYKPTMQDAINYGKFVAEKTQFLFGPLQTPHYVSGPFAKSTLQFQTFNMKQAEFIANLVVDKEYAKFARYMISSSLLFGTIGTMFGMDWDDSWNTVPFLSSRMQEPPIIKFATDLWGEGVLGEDKYGNVLNAEERVAAAGKTLFTNIVPAGAQIKRSIEGFQAVDEGVVNTKGGNFKYNVDQTPTNYIRGSLFGTYNLPETQEYYDKQDQKKKDSAKRRSGSSSGSRSGRY